MKNIKLNALPFLTLILFMLVTACKTTNEEDPIELDLIPIKSVDADGYTIQLFSYEVLEEGVNDLFWQVEKNNNLVSLQSFSIVPRISQGPSEHSCPYDEPILFKQNKNYYHNTIIFNQAGSESNPWLLDVEFTTKSNDHVSHTMTLDVAPSWRVKNITSIKSNTYNITWRKPRRPVVGINELEMMIHKQMNLSTFPPVGGATIEILPYIDLGGGTHQAPNYGNPVSSRHGLYIGFINFDQADHWHTSVKLMTSEDTLQAVLFEYDVVEE